MLTPETVNRNEYGDWAHSAFTELLGDREIIPMDELNTFFEKHNIETALSAMEDELDPEHPAWIAHFEDGEAGSVGWSPEPPGPEWHVLSIHETEDGPIVIWYREKQEGYGHE